MENKSNSSRFKWLILIFIILAVMLGICATCIGFVFVGSGDFNSANSISSNSDYVIKGNSSETIAVIPVDGVILDASEVEYRQNMVDFIVSSLEKAKKDNNVKAVVLVLNTPGGSTYDTARIGDKIDEVKAEGKLVVAVMEQIAASGGYWLAAKTDYIVAGPETITGSVGALWDIMMYDRLFDKIGIDQITIHNIESPNKTIGDTETRNPDSEKYKILQELANRSYEEFVGVVLEGRNKTKEELGQYLDGRILDGRQAVEVGMADKIGYFEDALEYIKSKLSLSSPDVRPYEREKMSPFGSIFVKLNNLVQSNPESLFRMRIMYMPQVLSGNNGTRENK